MSACSAFFRAEGEGRVEQIFQDEIANLIGRVVEGDETAFNNLLAIVSDECEGFSLLSFDFRSQIYPHVLDGLILRERYEDAKIYLDQAIAINGGHSVDFFNSFHYEILIQSRIKLRDFSGLSCSEQENAKKVSMGSFKLILQLDDLLGFSNGHPVPSLLKRVLGLSYYNMALSVSALFMRDSFMRDISKGCSIVLLRKALAVLDRPIDRLIRAEISCGIAFLSGQTPRLESLGLSEEEAAFPESQRVFDQWKGLATEAHAGPGLE
jgi:hypothetical protein